MFYHKSINKKMRLIFFTALLGTVLFYSFSYGAEANKTVERLYGQTRYDTAVAISKKGWTICDNVVLARGEF